MDRFFKVLLLYAFLRLGSGVELASHFSENGLDGTITFKESSGWSEVFVDVTTPDKWTWSIKEFPVDYSEIENRCTFSKLGKTLYELSELLGDIDNSTSLLNISSNTLPLIGDKGIWSRSLFLKDPNGNVACATIMASGMSNVKVAEAFFPGDSGIYGKVLIQWFGSRHGSDAVFYTDLQYPESKRRRSEHDWKIYTTDILDSEADKARSDCNSLQVILMDLSARVGRLKCGERSLIRDQYLPHPDLGNNQRNHFLVLIDNNHPDTFLTCARIVPKPPILLKAMINSNSIQGWISLEQGSELTPTKVVKNLTSAPIIGGFRIHTLPAIPPLDNKPKLDRCLGIGEVFNPTAKGVAADAPYPGEETQDKYAIGDLSGKVGYSASKEWDVYLPLSGKDSVFFRTLVLYKNGLSGVEEPWICSTLIHYEPAHPDRKIPLLAAEAFYRYPLVGRLMFYQHGTGETTIIVEGLVHADGTSLNTTHEHRWAITEFPPGKDFYNWTARCVSAGLPYNPYKVNVNTTKNGLVGALSDRLKHLSIAGSKKFIQVSRQMFTDRLISLSSRNSILGRSLVIFDDHGPKARGERLACSKITSIPRRKAVARDWFGNGIPNRVSGKIEFFQQNEFGVTDVEVMIEGMTEPSAYSIHMTPVLEILEFPCEESTLYGIYNPHEVSKEVGFTDVRTPDSFKAGDLSSKFGLISPVHSEMTYNDSTLAIFGQASILGRSIVLRHQGKEARLACATIERGYAPSEAREIRAIASFHHPDGFAYGYIRMTQLIHNDGSTSDTVLEVNLRHPGKQDRNMTTGHNWAIYVNPVGVDAAVKILHTRCTAAGYIWNPYYTQLADPLNDELYRQECGPDLPLRCYVGDLSGRLGPIDLGKGRKVFSDANFPLEGKVSAMGKSIVILNQNGGHEKFACANIEPDYDTVKFVNIRRPPKFVVSQFLEDIREVMGIPEWYLTIDSRKTNILYGGACIQLFVHFKGPQANKLEQDFSRLLSTGRLASPSLWIPGYIPKKKKPTTTAHKLCPSGYSAINSNDNDLLNGAACSLKSFSKVTIAASLLSLLRMFQILA